MNKLSLFFECDIGWLATGKGEPFPKRTRPEKENIEIGAGVTQEQKGSYQAERKSLAREIAIGKLETVISFLVDTYGDLPSMMDDCLQQMKTELRKNNPDFRQWEYEQQDKLLARRKEKGRKGGRSPNIQDEKEVNGSQ